MKTTEIADGIVAQTPRDDQVNVEKIVDAFREAWRNVPEVARAKITSRFPADRAGFAAALKIVAGPLPAKGALVMCKNGQLLVRDVAASAVQDIVVNSIGQRLAELFASEGWGIDHQLADNLAVEWGFVKPEADDEFEPIENPVTHSIELLAWSAQESKRNPRRQLA